MLSNPYASAIDADAFLAANPEIDALVFLGAQPSPKSNISWSKYRMGILTTVWMMYPSTMHWVEPLQHLDVSWNKYSKWSDYLPVKVLESLQQQRVQQPLTTR